MYSVLLMCFLLNRKGFLRRCVPVEGVWHPKWRARELGAGEVIAVTSRRLPGRVLPRSGFVFASESRASLQAARRLSRDGPSVPYH